MKTHFYVLSIIILFLTLTACGGGGGGGGGTPPPVEGDYQTPVAASTWQPFVGPGISAPVMDIFNKDLNNDGVDEVIIAGRKSQPATSVDWQNFNVQIFGWNTGSFANETANWFSGSDNIIVGTEPAVKFGDFDGDSNVDIVMSATTDDTTRSIYGNTVVYHNNGNGTLTRSTLPASNQWSHDILTHDFDNNGRDDIMAVDYGPQTTISFGEADDTFTTHITDTPFPAATYSASGISAADYVPGGNVEIIMSDSGMGNGRIDDTRMFSWSASGGVLTFTDLGTTIPGSRYTLEQSNASIYGAHAIRNTPMDFDDDGDVDVVVFERLTDESTVQFLSNDGIGNFTDVTDTTLVNYNTSNGGVNYQPVLDDFNGDGLTDIFLSGGDFDGTFDQTQILVQSSDGKFVSKYSDVFTSFYDTIYAATDAKAGLEWGQALQIAKGPDNEYYVIGNIISLPFDLAPIATTYVTTYSAKIGAKPVTAPQTAAELASSEWPYP